MHNRSPSQAPWAQTAMCDSVEMTAKSSKPLEALHREEVDKCHSKRKTEQQTKPGCPADQLPFTAYYICMCIRVYYLYSASASDKFNDPKM